MENNNIFDKYKTFVMVGKSGSGKGVQAKLLSEMSGFTVFSTGDKLRELKKTDTLLGHKIASVIDNGQFMPYWFASFLFQEAVLYLPESEGLIYEGAARKESEAELFHEVMTWLERPYLAIYLETTHEEVTKRLLKRKEVEGRDDDHEEAIKARLAEYEKWVVPSIEVFRRNGTLLEINGEQSIEDVHKEILEKLSKR